MNLFDTRGVIQTVSFPMTGPRNNRKSHQHFQKKTYQDCGRMYLNYFSTKSP